MLLDHCQAVLIYPVKVIPRLAYTSSLPPTFLLEYTWNKHQSTKYHTSQVLNALLLIPGIGLEILRVPVRIHSLDSSQCPKAMKKSVREQSPPPSEDHDFTDVAENSASDQERDLDVSFHPVVPPIIFLQCLYHILRDPK